MRKLIAPAFVSLIVLAVSLPAQAVFRPNGVSLNGTKVNGVFVNGGQVNGQAWNRSHHEGSRMQADGRVRGVALRDVKVTLR